tara:strand:+ start:3082 stop:4668 length:1587 start_codon:yes stop_codon:yes gene_type:complete
MAIKISGTTVIDDSRNVTDVENVGDANTVYNGSGANLTGVQAGSASFTASGAISNGDPVVINSNGTVSTAVRTGDSKPSAGTPTTFEDGTVPTGAAVAYHPDSGKFVIAFSDQDDSNKGKALLATVSGDSVTFSDPVVFYSSTVDEFIDITYVSDDAKIVITFRTTSDGRAVVGTVSDDGSSISFGSSTQFNNQTIGSNSVCYHAAKKRLLIAFRWNGNNNYGAAVAGTISGTSISYNSKYQFKSNNTDNMKIVYEPVAEKAVIFFKDFRNGNSGSERGACCTADVNATNGAISYSSINFFNDSSSHQNTGAAYDPDSGKIIVSFKGYSSGNKSRARTVAVNADNTFTFGTVYEFDTTDNREDVVVYSSLEQKALIAYRDGSDSNKGKMVSATVTGTAITFSSDTTFEDGAAVYIGGDYDSATGKILLGYKDDDESNDIGKAVVVNTDGRTANLTSENYIGIAAEAISDGSSGSITIAGGTNTGVTGLTTGAKTFVLRDGDFSTTASIPSVVAGTATSDTKIIVRTFS